MTPATKPRPSISGSSLPKESTTAPASFPRRVLAQALWDLKFALSHGEQLLVAFFLPAIAMFGAAGASFLPVDVPAGKSLIDVIAPGVLALAAFSSAFTGQAIGTGFDRRSDVLLHLGTTPLGRTGFLTGRSLALAAQVVVQMLVLGALALLLGWQPVVAGLPAATVAVVVGSTAFTLLALALAGTLRAEAVLAAANVILVVSAMLGVVLPATALPAWLEGVAPLTPAGALGDALRAALVHGTWDIVAIATLAAWAALGAIITSRWFTWHS